jgi:DNA polymerase III epsilon subunit-like protein
MSWIMVDVETDGPCPGLFSMISVGAIVIEPVLERTFFAKLRPMTERFDTEALKVNGLTREQTMMFPPALRGVYDFAEWVGKNGGKKPMFISDNNGFDWQFVNYYFHHYLDRNPFGHSSTNLGSLYKGLVKDMTLNFKHLRQTRHTHNPVDDARGNAEAFLHMQAQMGLVVPRDKAPR